MVHGWYLVCAGSKVQGCLPPFPYPFLPCADSRQQSSLSMEAENRRRRRPPLYEAVAVGRGQNSQLGMEWGLRERERNNNKKRVVHVDRRGG